MENELAALVKHQNQILSELLELQEPKKKKWWKKGWNMLWIVLSGLAVLFTAAFPGYELCKAIESRRTARESFRTLLATGDALMQERETNQALKKYEQALLLFPGDTSALLKVTRGRSYTLNEKYENIFRRLTTEELNEIQEFRADCTLLTQMQPQDADSFRLLGNALQLDKRLEESISALRVAIKKDPNKYETYNILGNTLRKNGQRNEAIRVLNDAITLAEKQNVQYAKAYNNRGLVFLEDRDFEQARRDFDKAIQLDREYYEPYSNRGMLFEEQARSSVAGSDPRQRKLLDLAKLDYLTAIALRPNVPDAYFNLANLLLRQRKFRSALEYYDGAVRLDPQASDVHNNRGLALMGLGNNALALQEFSTAISSEPQNIEAHKNRASLYRLLGQFEQAASEEETVRILRRLRPEGTRRVPQPQPRANNERRPERLLI